MIKNLTFESFEFNLRKEIVFGVDTTNKYFIKIQIIKNKNKAKDIQQEYEVIRHLNKQGCKTCPQAYETGMIKKSDFYSKVKEKEVLDSISEIEFQYIIQDFIPDSSTYNLADIILTLIEQKKLGVYQGDIKPANIRFDQANGICYFIDYDQSILLNSEQINLDNNSFLDFCSAYDKNKYGFGNWLRHFPRHTSHDVARLFINNSFNLEETTIFNTQNTTNTKNGIYHTVDEKDIFIKGSRTVNSRTALLDEIEFGLDEKVLDVGCNAGLLSLYLHDRGCQVTGIDNDPHIIIASKIISNILNKNIDYLDLDLDKTEQIDSFDTIVLFSVLHHTRKPIENAKKLINSCSRIILETRLTERGKQPSPGYGWLETTHWSFNNVDELVSYCEGIFDGFKLRTNLGKADKNRYILEFVK